MQITNTFQDMCNYFTPWRESTLQSKYDKIMWDESQKRFILLGRELLDCKIDKIYYTGFLGPARWVSESVLTLTKKVSEYMYMPDRIAVLSKIIEKSNEVSDEISLKDNSNRITDLEELDKSTSTFYKGLKNIYEFSKKNPDKNDFNRKYQSMFLSAMESMLLLNKTVNHARALEYSKQLLTELS